MALIDYSVALERVLSASLSAHLPVESVSLRAAFARVLAESVSAPFAVPGFNHAAMDGYAIALPLSTEAGAACLTLTGKTLVGDPPFRTLSPSEALFVATGAALPSNITRVIPVENCLSHDANIQLSWTSSAPTYIRNADDDYAAQQPAFAAGMRIGFGALGVLASFGFERINVFAQPKISVVITGSELRCSGEQRLPGQIFDSNGALLHGLLKNEGITAEVSAPIADDMNILREGLRTAASKADVVITSGGVSAGPADYIPRVLTEIGEIIFWKVAIRPGMPVLFGKIGATWVFSLPGNPVSVVASFLAFVRPCLRALEGAAQPARRYARLASAIEKFHDRTEFRRGRLNAKDDGTFEVMPHSALSSGVLRSVAESNALLILPAERKVWVRGDVVEVLPFISGVCGHE